MYLVGLTGGIATGKSTVMKMFEEQGVPCYSADVMTHGLLEGKLKEPLRRHFGEAIVDENGSVNRKALREIVFDDFAMLDWLEDLVHPEIIAEIKSIGGMKSTAYAMIEVPLLFEKKLNDCFNFTIATYTGDRVQMERLRERLGDNNKFVGKIIARQLRASEHRDIADFSIDTSQSLDSTRLMVRELHKMFLLRSNRWSNESS